MEAFGERLMKAVKQKKTPVMVGIDPRLEQLPAEFRDMAPPAAYLKFTQGVIDAVADLVGVVKFQAAFFEALGSAGLAVLDYGLRYAGAKNLVVILDGKRGDIGSTADAYAEAYLTRQPDEKEPWRADALTVNPFLGRETVEPFVRHAQENGTGVFVLVRTSNPGSADLQKMIVDGSTISERIARWVEDWSKATTGPLGFGSVGAVVGATHRDEIVGFRELMPHVPILLPGYGAQGAKAQDLVSAFNKNGLGAIVNNSRGLIFAHQNEKYQGLGWQEAVRAATLRMMSDLADHTPAGNL